MKLEGKPLSFWLQELICDDIERRDLAAPLLSRFDDEFKEAVQATLSEPDFPRIEWMNQLIDFLFWVQQARSEIRKQEKERSDRVWEKLTKTSSPRDVLTKSPRRVRRWMLSVCDPNNPNERQLDVLLQQSFAAQNVFGTLGNHVLALPERVCQMLDAPYHAHPAATILEELGTQATELFAEELWQRWLADFRLRDSLLASVIRESPEYIRRVGVCLESSYPTERRRKAASVLAQLGDSAVALVPQCVPIAREWLEDTALCRTAIGFLGLWTKGQEPSTERLLALSYSDDIWIKKTALQALGDVNRSPEQVLPRLIAALDDYQEPDSDDTYHSDHEIVTDALRAFGPAAAPAVPALLERIVQKEPEVTLEFELDGTWKETRRDIVDRGVVTCLVAIGAAAIPALPILERYADQATLASLEREGEEDSFDRDWLEVAVLRLRRFQKAGTP